jgi:hypothetical protein
MKLLFLFLFSVGFINGFHWLPYGPGSLKIRNYVSAPGSFCIGCVASESVASFASHDQQSTSVFLQKESGSSSFAPVGISYFHCPRCRSAFVEDEEMQSKMESLQDIVSGMQVKCSVCSNSWFHLLNMKQRQTTKSLALLSLTEEQIVTKQMKYRRLSSSASSTAGYHDFRTRGPKESYSLFVAGLPYEYGEKQVSDLFAEYGLTRISLGKDEFGNFRGFAFLDVRFSVLSYFLSYFHPFLVRNSGRYELSD